MHFWALGKTLKWDLKLFFLKVFFFKVTIFFFLKKKVKYALTLLGQIMQSFQFDLKNFYYSLCEIQSVFLFFSLLFFFFFYKKKYLILIFCLLLITNLFKTLFERWRLDSDS
jgi:hypothetical protein